MGGYLLHLKSHLLAHGKGITHTYLPAKEHIITVKQIKKKFERNLCKQAFSTLMFLLLGNRKQSVQQYITHLSTPTAWRSHEQLL